MLTEVAIENFRGFGGLTLSGLGRVNLVVGRNNAGKTSLLEAITLLADWRRSEDLPTLLRSSAKHGVGHFFPWLPRDGAGGIASLRADFADRSRRRVVLTWGIQQSTATERLVLRQTLEDLRVLEDGPAPISVHAISVHQQSPDALVDAFAEAVRAPADERQLEELLRAVDPRIQSIRVDVAGSRPFIVVDLGLSKRVPLSQAGQGVFRLVAILSELLGRKPRVCLIDEVENGIHHSALADLWRGIAEVATRLDVQIFATTHSWECLVAAHEAFSGRDPYELRVVQLYRLDGAIAGRVLDREHVEAAIDGRIEVR